MRFNTDRARRLAFDEAADAYDGGRPAIPQRAVDDALVEAEIQSGMDVLEVGAGTGQLTGALVHRCMHVTALEPGDALRRVLASKFDTVDCRGELFEDFEPGEPFDAIASANAFHWIDPAVGYGKAADLLRPGGGLILFWTYLIVRNDAERDRLRAYAGDVANFLPEDPDAFLAAAEEGAAQGREQLRASGRFFEPAWTTERYEFVVTPAAYVDLVFSFANSAGQGTGQERARLRASIDTGIVFDNYVYAVTSRSVR